MAVAEVIEGPNPSGLCLCGCGERTPIAPANRRVRGWVRGKPIRYLHGHANRLPHGWHVNPVTGCWIWAGATGSPGRPVFTSCVGTSRVEIRAHRWVYEREVGPLADGLVLHHRCENTLCVNPAHMQPMTKDDHLREHARLRRTRVSA